MLGMCWGSLDKRWASLGRASATSNFVAAELRTLELDGCQRYNDTKDTNDARTQREDTFTD